MRLGAAHVWRQPQRFWVTVPERTGLRLRTPGQVGQLAERLEIVHGQVGEHLAVDIDAGSLLARP